MCRVTMLQTHVYRITSESLQKRTGVFSLENYLARVAHCSGQGTWPGCTRTVFPSA